MPHRTEEEEVEASLRGIPFRGPIRSVFKRQAVRPGFIAAEENPLRALAARGATQPVDTQAGPFTLRRGGPAIDRAARAADDQERVVTAVQEQVRPERAALAAISRREGPSALQRAQSLAREAEFEEVRGNTARAKFLRTTSLRFTDAYLRQTGLISGEEFDVRADIRKQDVNIAAATTKAKRARGKETREVARETAKAEAKSEQDVIAAATKEAGRAQTQVNVDERLRQGREKIGLAQKALNIRLSAAEVDPQTRKAGQVLNKRFDATKQRISVLGKKGDSLRRRIDRKGSQIEKITVSIATAISEDEAEKIIAAKQENLETAKTARAEMEELLRVNLTEQLGKIDDLDDLTDEFENSTGINLNTVAEDISSAELMKIVSDLLGN